MAEQPPDDLIELIHSAIDQLNNFRNVNETIRRLRLARTRTASTEGDLITMLDNSLDQLESPGANIDNIIWHLEDELANFNIA